MSAPLTPRQMIKAWLHGEAPPRPFLVPFVFSLAAKLEGMPLRGFLSNPTKICNGLRQIHRHLQLDGITCYFDPLLEADALGCLLDWDGDSVRLSRPSQMDTVEENLAAPETLPGKGRLPIACEVFRRLRTMMANGPALMARVTGPYTLAAQLKENSANDSDLIASCAEVAMVVSRSFLEAGAHVVFVSEACLPELTSDKCQTYGELLEPIVNIVRFYDAMPVLQLGSFVDQRTVESLAGFGLQCVVCPVAASVSHSTGQDSMGLALPASVWCGGIDDPSVDYSQAVLLSSDGDVKVVDLQAFANTVGALRAA